MGVSSKRLFEIGNQHACALEDEVSARMELEKVEAECEARLKPLRDAVDKARTKRVLLACEMEGVLR